MLYYILVVQLLQTCTIQLDFGMNRRQPLHCVLHEICLVAQCTQACCHQRTAMGAHFLLFYWVCLTSEPQLAFIQFSKLRTTHANFTLINMMSTHQIIVCTIILLQCLSFPLFKPTLSTPSRHKQISPIPTWFENPLPFQLLLFSAPSPLLTLTMSTIMTIQW